MPDHPASSTPSQPVTPIWLRCVLGATLALLLVLPVASVRGWTRPWEALLTHLFPRFLLHSGSARFGVVIIVGACAYALLAGGRARRYMALGIVQLALISAGVLAWAWQPLNLQRAWVDPWTHAILVSFELSFVAIGVILLFLLTRSWRLSAGVLIAFTVMLFLGYLRSFVRGSAWLIPPFDIPFTLSSYFVGNADRILRALFQPIIAITLVLLGLRERRDRLAREGRCCCGYLLRGTKADRCPECGRSHPIAKWIEWCAALIRGAAPRPASSLTPDRVSA